MAQRATTHAPDAGRRRLLRALGRSALLTGPIAACGGGGGGAPGPGPDDGNRALGGDLPFGRAVRLAVNTPIQGAPAATIDAAGLATVAWTQSGLPVAGGVIPRPVPDVGVRESAAADQWSAAVAVGPVASSDLPDDQIVDTVLVAGRSGSGARLAFSRLKSNPNLSDGLALVRRLAGGWQAFSLDAARAATARRVGSLALASNGAGTEAVAWVEAGATSAVAQVRVLVADGAGVPAGSFAVQGASAAAGSSPACAVDEAGNVMVVWREGAAGAGVLRFRLFEAISASWGPPGSVDAAGRPDVDLPRVVATDVNRFVATWLEVDVTGAGRGLRARAWSGAAWQASTAVIATDVSSADAVQLASAGPAAALAVWRQADGLAFSRWAVGQWSLPARVEPGVATSAPRSPRLATDASGAGALTWLRAEGPVNDLLVARLAPGAASFGAAVSARVGSGSAGVPTIALAPNGSAVLAWLQTVAGQAHPDLLVRLLRR